MAGGRPPKLTKELREKAVEYIQDCTVFGDVVPSIAGLAVALDITRQTIYDWINPKSERFDEEFSYITEKALSKQERDLLNGSLHNEMNATIAKLMLSKHGYAEKQELTGKDGKDLIPSEVEQMSNEQLEAIIQGRSA